MPKIVLRGLLLLGLLLPLPALAVLGGDEGSVQSDRVQMRAAVSTTRNAAFTVHEMKADTGLTIREYVSPAGKVFGVSWQGPVVPNYRQILGSYYDQISQARQAQKSKSVVRGPINIQQSGVVFQQAGHMRSYFGRAYVPALVPQGVAPESVQ